MESLYELERRQKIAVNEQILKDLGLFQQSAISVMGGRRPAPQKDKTKKTNSKTSTQSQENDSQEPLGEQVASTRRVTRSSTQAHKTETRKEKSNMQDIDPSVSFIVEDNVEPEVETAIVENVFGPIPGIEVGRVWDTRMECSKDRVHRPPVAGIHGSEEYGCYSLAMSGTGEYNEDLDWGDSFTYTGEGGRNLKGTKNSPKNLRTAAQSKAQTLTRGNLALSRNFYNRKPVRVIRGYKLRSSFAPPDGYRYDGLYTVEKFWETKGTSGHIVLKFALKRCPDQPIPWITADELAGRETREQGETESEAKTELATVQ